MTVEKRVNDLKRAEIRSLIDDTGREKREKIKKIITNYQKACAYLDTPRARYIRG